VNYWKDVLIIHGKEWGGPKNELTLLLFCHIIFNIYGVFCSFVLSVHF
jgi:hypothetical protein